MLSQHRVFRLSQLASLRSTSLPDTATSTSEWVATPTSTSSGAAGTSPSEVILDVAVSLTGEALVVVTGSTERPSLSILVTPCEENDLERKGRGKRPVKCWRRVPWLESGDLVPRCVTFSPGNDFVLVVVRSGGLYVIPTPLLFDDLLPVASKGECAGFLVWQNLITFFYCALYFFSKIPDKDPNYREWSSTSYTAISRSKPVSGSIPRALRSSNPRTVLWWTTQEFHSMGLVGTEHGELVCVDLVTGDEVSKHEPMFKRFVSPLLFHFRSVL